MDTLTTSEIAKKIPNACNSKFYQAWLCTVFEKRNNLGTKISYIGNFNLWPLDLNNESCQVRCIKPSIKFIKREC